jgi:hypothetical protein
VDGTARRTVGHLAGSNPYLQAVTERTRTVSWLVRPTGAAASIRVVGRSDTGGVHRSAWVAVR